MFDETYINGCEDVDLCLRFNRKGLFNYVVHDSVVLHVKGDSEGRLAFNKKNEFNLLKNGKEKLLLIIFLMIAKSMQNGISLNLYLSLLV